MVEMREEEEISDVESLANAILRSSSFDSRRKKHPNILISALTPKTNKPTVSALSDESDDASLVGASHHNTIHDFFCQTATVELLSRVASLASH